MTTIKTLLLALLSFAAFAQTTQIPELEIQDLDGKVISSTSIRANGKINILIFWATWQKPAIYELMRLDELYGNEISKDKVNIIAVSIDDARNTAKVKPFVEGKGWTYSVFKDPNAKLLTAMAGKNASPYTCILDKSGKIVFTHEGFEPGDEALIIAAIQKTDPTAAKTIVEEVKVVKAPAPFKEAFPKVYQFKKPDTLQYKNQISKHMAMLKDGNQLLLAEIYTDEETENHGYVKGYGFSIQKYLLSGSKLQPEGAEVKKHLHFEESSMVSINNFRKQEDGSYVLCNEDMIIFYDKDLKIVHTLHNTSKTNDRLYIDICKLKGTSRYLIVTAEKANKFRIFDFDLSTKRFANKDGFYFQHYDGIFSKSFCIGQVDEEHFIVAYNFGLDEAIIKKYKIADLTAPGKQHILGEKGHGTVWMKFYTGMWEALEVTKDGKLKGLLVQKSPGKDYNDIRIVKFELDLKTSTEEALQASLIQNKMTLPLERASGYKRLANGDYILMGEVSSALERQKEGVVYASASVFCHIDNKNNAYTLYKLPLEDRHEMQDYNISRLNGTIFTNSGNGTFYARQHNMTRFWSDSKKSFSTLILTYHHHIALVPLDERKGQIELFDKNIIWDFHFDESSKDLYIMTAMALIKANLNNVEDAPRPPKVGDKY